MNRETLKAELLQPWRETLQDTVGAIPEAEVILDDLTLAIAEGRESAVSELTGQLRLLAEQRRLRVNDAAWATVRQSLSLIFRAASAGLAAALSLLLFVGCQGPQGYVDANAISPTLLPVLERHDRFLDDDPTNDPVPQDEREREVWLRSSRMLRETVETATIGH